ncbi:MAG: signal peptidase I [Actinomycetes bacterium]
MRRLHFNLFGEQVFWHPPANEQEGANLFVVIKNSQGRLSAAKLANGFASTASANELPFESTFLTQLRVKRKFGFSGYLSVIAYLIAAILVAASVLTFSGTLSVRNVLTSSMVPTFYPGDVVVAANWLKPKVGDIAIYQERGLGGAVRAEFVHRVISGSASTKYIFRGDNNPKPDLFPVKASDVVGVVQFWVPGLGGLAKPQVVGPVVVTILLLYFLFGFWLRRRRESASQVPLKPNRLKLVGNGQISFEELPAGTELEIYSAWASTGKSPQHLLIFAKPNGAVNTKQLIDSKTKSEPREKEVGVKTLKPWLKRLLSAVVSILAIALVLIGLRLGGVFAFEHVQVGPELPLGNATAALIGVVPGGTPKPGELAVATVDGKRNLVRVNKISGDSYEIGTTTATISIKADQLNGPLLFVVPFVGYLWLPFGQ